MKQIPLLQGKALLVELPNLKLITIIHKGLLVAGVNQKDVSSKCIKINRGDVKGFLQLPSSNWRIIGMLSELTEEQTANLVETIGYIGHDTDTWPVFKDYNDNQDGFLYPLESLESAILAEGWYFENPLENERNKIGLGTLDNFDQDYEQAQSRVLDRSRCLLLEREI